MAKAWKKQQDNDESESEEDEEDDEDTADWESSHHAIRIEDFPFNTMWYWLSR